MSSRMDQGIRNILHTDGRVIDVLISNGETNHTFPSFKAI